MKKLFYHMRPLGFFLGVIAALSAHGQTITTFAGNGQPGSSGDGALATNSSLNGPYGITKDQAGNIFVADTYGERVRKIDATGNISTIVGTGISSSTGDGALSTAATVNTPFDVKINGSGDIFIAEYSGARIRKIDHNT